MCKPFSAEWHTAKLLAYHECAHPFADKGRKNRLDLAGTTCIHNHDARAEDTCRVLYIPYFGRGLGDVGRVEERRNRSGWRHQVVHQLKAFCDQLHGEDRNACDVAAGSCEASDEANFDWVGTDKKNDRNCLGRRLSGQGSWCASPYDPRRTKSAANAGSRSL